MTGDNMVVHAVNVSGDVYKVAVYDVRTLELGMSGSTAQLCGYWNTEALPRQMYARMLLLDNINNKHTTSLGGVGSKYYTGHKQHSGQECSRQEYFLRDLPLEVIEHLRARAKHIEDAKHIKDAKPTLQFKGD